MKIQINLILILFTLIFLSCTAKPDFPIEPHLEFRGFDKNKMKQGSLNSDSITIFLYFTDGDGDIGFSEADSAQNLFVIDSRTNKIAESIKIPKIDDTGIGNGISGDIQLKLYTTCCLFENNIPPCSVVSGINYDTLRYQIYMIDNAGHKSETVETNDIILECK